MVSSVRLGLKKGEVPPIVASTVFHGVLLIATEGGGVYMWRETEWVRLPAPVDSPLMQEHRARLEAAAIGGGLGAPYEAQGTATDHGAVGYELVGRNSAQT